MEECGDVETPRSWIWWSLISAISAVAANGYYVLTFSGKVKFKPNMYVILLGDSGLGKSFPVKLAKLLVTKSEATRVIAGRSSIQAIVQELGTSRTNANGKPPFTDARAFIVNGELSSAIIADPDALSILTDIYDGADLPEWTNLLKGDGPKVLKEPYVTALFGSSPAHFYDSIPQANIEGGYIGRNMVVYEEKRFKEIDAFSDDDHVLDDKLTTHIIPEYSRHLIEVAKKKGRMVVTSDAKNFYNDWRAKWRKEQKPDKTGFINRVPGHVIKTAMCISLSRYDSAGIVHETDITEAIERVVSLIYANKMASDGNGPDPLAKQMKLVLDLLIAAEHNELYRRQLLTKGYGSYKTTELDTITDNLIEMGWVERERYIAGKNSDWLIKLSGEPLDNYKKFLKSQGR